MLADSGVYAAFKAALSTSLAAPGVAAAFGALPPGLRPHALGLKLWRIAGSLARGPPPLADRATLAPQRQRPAGGVALTAPWPRVTYLSAAPMWQGAFSGARLREMADELGAPAQVALLDVTGAPLPGVSQDLGAPHLGRGGAVLLQMFARSNAYSGQRILSTCFTY